MTYLSQPHANRRVPRFRLADVAPAVLQLHDGRRTPTELQVISRTGGLLFLSKPLDHGTVVELMFQTHKGPVLGTAEMLLPVTCTQQPFRFLALPESDQSTLQAAFQSALYRNTDEEEWIEEFRAAAVVNWNPYPSKHFFRAVVAAAIAAILCLGSAVYVFSIRLK
jgi:hypothetical protein